MTAVPAQAPFNAFAVTQVISQLGTADPSVARRNWLRAVATRTANQRPDLAPALVHVLGVEPGGPDVLAGLSIGEIGVCYEALLAHLDRGQRKGAGQYFTPDDAAGFMASHHSYFPPGRWLDPCCGVGNLSWHLTHAQADPGVFIRSDLILVDQDPTALTTAVAIIAADFAGPGDIRGVYALWQNATTRDFLSPDPLPTYDFAILNPPYAQAPIRPEFRSGNTKDLFAYFFERVATTARGFIAVTPASYLSIPKFAPLRTLLSQEQAGGDVYVFDNVPDTLFRGYKYGSENTSKTNFVRAAITVCSPNRNSWRITPILRWNADSRTRMFNECASLLGPRYLGPNSEWAKLPSYLWPVWEVLTRTQTTIADLTVGEPTPFSLTVATTPRYYISAAFRNLRRASKRVLYFRTDADRNWAAVVLNSSIPYLWWRALDGGVSLPLRVLMSLPLPPVLTEVSPLITVLRDSEANHVVTKRNAGRVNENVKHPPHVVHALNDALIPGFNDDLEMVYSPNMFPGV